ncbi:MAG TPA: hypothetical protein VLI05_00055 [Candidatus Saccharimonadia bacterium]|nr:hypothetical protein [Candidatus Saccharimonadia bacterium]
MPATEVYKRKSATDDWVLHETINEASDALVRNKVNGVTGSLHANGWETDTRVVPPSELN